VHEALTLMASDCLSSQEARPSICVSSRSAVRDYKVVQDETLALKVPVLGAISRKELAEAVRWPDDPTREVAVKTIAKFGVKMKFQCKSLTGGLRDGLLCSSHYGPLQYWHAMASSCEESTVETQGKVLAWAEFLYEVAAGADLNQPHCEYWQAQPKEGKGKLAAVLAPDDGFPCNKDGAPWVIGTPFSLKCPNPFSSLNCDVLSERAARLSALGALLHMVQDSYAQGHTTRGSCEIYVKDGRPLSKIECRPISQFYTYDKQAEWKHSEADAPPQIESSCLSGSTEVDDPILASAIVLWIVQQQKGTTALTDYLKERVFLLAKHHKPQAGTGDCFAEQLMQIDKCRVKNVSEERLSAPNISFNRTGR